MHGLLILGLVVCALFGAPLFVVLGGTAMLNFEQAGTPIVVLSEEHYKLATNPHLITIPLFKEHKILSQVAGHGSHTVKLLPPLVISDADCTWIETSFDAVIADSHRVPGAVWSLGKTLVDHAIRARK